MIYYYLLLLLITLHIHSIEDVFGCICVILTIVITTITNNYLTLNN